MSHEPVGSPQVSDLHCVLTFFDLLVYGLVYVAPVGPWSTWEFTSDLAGGQWPSRLPARCRGTVIHGAALRQNGGRGAGRRVRLLLRPRRNGRRGRVSIRAGGCSWAICCYRR